MLAGMSMQPLPPEHSLTRQEGSQINTLAASERSYLLRCFEYARRETQEHKKLELGISSVVAAITGGSVPGAIIIFLATLYGISLFHLLRSPKGLDEKHQKQLAVAQLLLEEEKAKNIEPKLAGEIKCLSIDTNFSSREAAGFDCYLTFDLMIWNESAAATTITGYTLKLNAADREYLAVNVPTEGYHIRHEVLHSAPWQSAREVKYEPMMDLQGDNDTPLTNVGHRRKWLRFCVEGVALSDVTADELKDHVTMTLSALDRKGQPHKIYEGADPKLKCEEIRRIEMPRASAFSAREYRN